MHGKTKKLLESSWLPTFGWSTDDANNGNDNDNDDDDGCEWLGRFVAVAVIVVGSVGWLITQSTRSIQQQKHTTTDEENLQQLQKQNKKEYKIHIYIFHTNDRQTDGRHYNWNSNKSGTTDNKNNHGINNNWRDKQQQNTIRATGHIIWSISWWVVCKQFNSPTNTMMMMMIRECAKHTHISTFCLYWLLSYT